MTTFMYEDVLQTMQDAQQEGYGHATMTINWETEEVTWGMCGSKAYFPENDSWHNDTHTYLSDFLLQFSTTDGYIPYDEPRLRQMASQWAFELSQKIPPPVWQRIYSNAETRG